MTVPGGSPLNYPTNSLPPLLRISRSRAPTSNDYKNFREGDEWLDTSSNDWWKLADITQNTALWVKIGGTSAAVESFIPDSGTSPVVPDASNQITTTGANGLTVVGGTNTLTFSTSNGEITTKFLPDTGTSPVVPDSAGEVTLAGGTGIITTGSLNTVTFDFDGSLIASQYDADTGSAVPSGGILNIVGGNGTVTSASGNTVVCEMQSPFVGDFSFESNTGGATETFTVQNTVDQASSGALMQVVVAGDSSSGDPVVKVASTSQRAAAMTIDTANDLVRWYRSVAGSTALTEEFMRVDGADASPRVGFFGPGGVVVSGGIGGTTSFLHVANIVADASSDAEILLQSGDPAVGAGGGSQYIRWGSENQVQFTLGMGKDASASTQPLEFKLGTSFSAGSTRMQLHPGAEGNITMNGTGALTVPTGTTGERPATPVNGMIRYNTTTAKFEGYEAGAWANLI